MSNNKVLTVSYGTFSCTLEGFEDSFGTMKAIAEYFRDLASDDRYFGAEPPQPDAEMLARIAEKEIARRVQASLDGGRVVLSAAPESAPAEATASAPAAEAPETAAIALDTAEIDAPQAEMAQMQASELAEVPADAESMEEPTEAFADAETTDEPTEAFADAETTDEPTEALADAEIVDEPTEALADVEPMEEPTEALADAKIVAKPTEALADAEIVAELAEAPADAEIIDAPEEEAAEDLTEAALPTSDAEAAAIPDAADGEDGDTPTGGVAAAAALAGAGAAAAGSTIADKLARIRAVVARSEAEAEAEAEDVPYIEDEHAEELMAETPSMSEMIEAVTPEDGPADDIAAEPVADTSLEAKDPEPLDAEDVAEDDVASILARLSAEAGTSEDTAAAATDVAAEPEVASEDTPELEVAAEDTRDLELAAEDTPEPETTAQDAPDLELAAEDTPEAEAAAEEALEPDPAADAAPQPAPAAPAPRVIKVKRADLEAAIAAGALEEVDASEDDLPEPEGAETSLSAEDEADLLRELAAVEAELPTTPAPETAPEPEPAPEAVAEPASKPEPDVDRLMAKADAEMGEPEGAKNRDAFAHLKAAVAARKSDTGLGEDDAGAVEGRYRTDLAAVVKPRRPAPRGEARDARPQPKVAPLKLVAEQRVDVPKAAAEQKGPVRPRRIASAPEAAGADGSFADYAEDMGAQSLPQLLEAAAAYLAFVENRETFSRPQIMNKVKMVEGNEFSREDGLRSFGMLLRAGKIEKLKGGRFAATGDTGYRPDARAAG
ncbi:MAG: hypothetical protein AAFY38_03875 [Pseudomonadota bacterium]